MVLLFKIVSVLLLIVNIVGYANLRSPMGWAILFPKNFSQALSPVLLIIAVFVFLMGLLMKRTKKRARAFLVINVLNIIMPTIFIGSIFLVRIESTHHFRQHANETRIDTPDTNNSPVWEKDVCFWKIKETDHALLCDIWIPPKTTKPSGLCFIYFHGSGWMIGDKDQGTRYLFKHLSSQGYVIMDVAYRKFPEADIYEMVGDAKRAVAWIKENAYAYSIDPNKVVIGGASAGGHIALLAAYTNKNLEFTPLELMDIDTSVAGVVSYYGPSDLEAMFYHSNQDKLNPAWNPSEKISVFKHAGMLEILLGTRPEQSPGVCRQFSPINYINADCPPTLLIHGKQDFVIPVSSTAGLYEKLKENDVPAVKMVLPYVSHIFELALPGISPAVRKTTDTLDQFLIALKRNYQHASLLSCSR